MRRYSKVRRVPRERLVNPLRLRTRLGAGEGLEVREEKRPVTPLPLTVLCWPMATRYRVGRPCTHMVASPPVLCCSAVIYGYSRMMAGAASHLKCLAIDWLLRLMMCFSACAVRIVYSANCCRDVVSPCAARLLLDTWENMMGYEHEA